MFEQDSRALADLVQLLSALPQTRQVGKPLALARARIFERSMPHGSVAALHAPQAQQISMVGWLVVKHFDDG
jgi:hypothetical protein